MSTHNHSVKKFCKVCHDAGKSEKEYTSHFVRSAPGPNGKVVCPTLLSMECRYCFKRGHTVKFCTLLKSKTQTKTQTTAPSKQKKESKEQPILPTNAFDVLLYESDKEEEDEEMADEFPILGEPVKLASSSTFSYADALAKNNKVTFAEHVVTIPKAVIIPKATTTTTIRKKFSWVDCESSSDEEEETQVEVEDNSAW
jgi:hypothetical protein